MKNLLIVLTVVGNFIYFARAQCGIAESCVTDLKQSDCPPEHYITLDAATKDCCPACVKYLKLGERCISSDECPPGTLCSTTTRACVINEDSCFQWMHLEPDKRPIYPPTCDIDETYGPVQCKGDRVAGRCFCSDKEGNRIFGMSWATDAQNMTCACSRMRAEMEQLGRNDVTLHCSADGNFETLQCDSKACWCVNEHTGDPTSMTVSEDLVSQLPCFDPDKYGSQYMRVCESKSHALALLINIMANHGTQLVTLENIICDYDGTYGKYRIDKGIAYCSWKDGGRLGSWQTEAGAILNTVNCYCARDSKYFEDAGKAFTMTCSGEGNYAPRQQINGQYYCVDRDGFPVTELKPLGEELDCSMYG